MPLTHNDLVPVDVWGTYEKLFNACDIDIGLSISEWISTYTSINGEPFSWLGYEYLIQPVNDMYPRQAIKKPAQVGASEAFARKMFAILLRYSLTPYYYIDQGTERCLWGINGIYSFPNTDDVRKFSKDRLMTDIISTSDTLRDAMKGSSSEAIDQIGVYNSFCYLTGRRTDAGNQSIPAEVVFVDEYDRPLTGDQKILGALKARVKNAKIFGNEYYRGLVVGYATPTYPDETGALIDGQYFLSDQHKWLVKCTRCNEWQETIEPDSIANYYEKGDKRPDKDPYWMCLKCKREFDFSEIGQWKKTDPLTTHNAQWVAEYPSRTKNGDGIRGYQIPFATLKNTAKAILTMRDEDYKHSIADYYNYGLGQAYRDNSIGITEEDFLKNIVEDAKWGYNDETAPHVIGIDQGCYITVQKLKPNSQTDINPKGIWITVHAEYCPEVMAFSKAIKETSGELKVFKGRISTMIDYWKPEVVIIDHLPNTASSESLAEEYPEVVWLNDSKGNALERIKFDKTDEDDNLIHRITENKHYAIDQLFDEIRNHKIEFATGGDDEFATLRTHCKNVKKVIDGTTFTYVSFGPDHYCQSLKMASEAAELYTKLKPRIKRAGILIIGGFAIKK
uniref:Putative terminase n=1 Tax=viral metagenome TaxID=1070528 RepID=A0A6H1ZAV5_9ZZZZ